MPIRIVIVDDHRVLRDGLRALLAREADFEVVGDAGDGRSAVECVRQTSPDLVLMDLNLPEATGIVCTQRILAERPGTKVLVLSGDPDLSHVHEALQAGAVGYVLKEEATVELVRAIRSVMNGEAHLSASATTALVGGLFREPPPKAPPPIPPLSEREVTVLKLVIDGLRNKEVAARMGVSVKSVETYRARLLAKLGCTTTAGLVRQAIRAGLVEL
jgi:DNA-binding NarL/FixJ family response regulator